MNSWKRKLCVLLLALSLCLTAAGCTAQKPEPEQEDIMEDIMEDEDILEDDGGVVLTAGFAPQGIPFPMSVFEKTEYNGAVFDVEDFQVNLLLPEGWTLRESRDNETPHTPHLLYNGAWSRVDILDGQENVVGCIGYNIYELYEGAEDEPAAIYNQIGLGNGYQFDVREAYAPVEDSQYHAAVTNVNYSQSFLEGLGEEGERTNRGILAYDSERLVYVAIEFTPDALSEEELKTVAASLSFTD